MITYYTEEDLVKFGQFLLSEERTNRILTNYNEGDPVTKEERLREVYHADISNWKEKQ